MDAVLEFRRHIGLHHGPGVLNTRGTAAEGDHVGIVVLLGHPGAVAIGAKGGPNALYPVSRDGDTDAGAAA